MKPPREGPDPSAEVRDFSSDILRKMSPGNPWLLTCYASYYSYQTPLTREQAEFLGLQCEWNYPDGPEVGYETGIERYFAEQERLDTKTFSERVILLRRLLSRENDTYYFKLPFITSSSH